MKEYDYSAWRAFLKRIEDAIELAATNSTHDEPLPFDDIELKNVGDYLSPTESNYRIYDAPPDTD